MDDMNDESGIERPRAVSERRYADAYPRAVKRRFAPRVLLSAAVILIVIGIAAYFYLWRDMGGAGQITAEEASRLTREVGSVILLPEGETPTVATVTDPAKLADQPFFKDSVSGDKVLIYAGSRKIILYRPSQKKIINVAVLNMDGS